MRHNFFIILTLQFMMSMGATGSASIGPILPIVSSFFHVSHSLSTLSISLFFLTYSLSFIPAGLLANYIGRRKTLFILFFIIILSTIIIYLGILVKSYHLFLIGRAFQGFIGAGFMMAFLLTSEIYSKNTIKYLSLILISVGFYPSILGVFVGLASIYFSIWGFFWVLNIFYLIAIILIILFIPETLTQEMKKQNNMNYFFHNIFYIFSSWKILSTMLMFGLFISLNMLFFAVSPLIASYYKITPFPYSILAFITVLGFSIGGFINARLTISYHQKMIRFGSLLLLCILFQISLIPLENFVSYTIYVYFTLWFFMLMIINILASSTSARAFSFGIDKNICSVILSSLGFLLVFCSSYIIRFNPISLLNIFIIFSVIYIIIFALYFLNKFILKIV